MMREQAGAAKVPIIFLILVALCVAGLAAIGQIGPPVGTQDNVGPSDSQQGAENFIEDFTGESLTSLEGQGWIKWYKPRMVETTGYEVNYQTEAVSVTEDETLEVGTGGGAGGFVYPANWGNYTLTSKFKVGYSPSETNWFGLAFRSENTWVSGTFDNPTSGSWSQNSYVVQLGLGSAYGTDRLWKIVNGGWTKVTENSHDIYPDSLWRDNWHEIKLEANGSSLNVYVDNESFLSATDSDLTSGGIGLLNCGGPVYFDDVFVSF